MITFPVSFSRPSSPVFSNLLVYLDAGNPSSYSGTGTTWTDLQGNDNGTLINGLTYSPDNMGSLTTNGSNDYIRIDTVAGTGTATQSFSYELWVNPSDSDGNIMSMSQSNPQNYWNMPPIAADGGKFRGKMWSNSYLYSPSFVQGSWYQVVLVWDYANSSQLLYVNGSLVDSESSISYTSSGVDNYIYLGQTNPGADDTGNFGGKYGIVRFYNKALSTDEVLINYKADSSRYSPSTDSLILFLDASKYSSGSTWSDNSSYGNSATIYNSPSNNGSSFNLNGTNQYFNVSGEFDDFTGGITVLSFANFGSASSWERIIDFGNGQADNNIILARSGTSTDLAFEVYGSGSALFSSTLTSGITNSGWGFYGARLDGSNYKILNGSTSTTGSTTVLPANVIRSNNYIGRSNWSSDAYFESQIGMVAIFNRSLSDAEIDVFYNLHKGTYGL